MDTNVLFEKYTIEEISAIEKKTRADIEKKKEDLRQMVGERYRDLIEAADTITDMKTNANNVVSSIGRMQQYCQTLKTMPTLQPRITRKHVDKTHSDQHPYVIAAQIKLLHEIPEKIWTALDSGCFLHATKLFLLARHVHTSLQLSAHCCPTLRLPIITTQWVAIAHFKDTVVDRCRLALRQSDMSTAEASQCLCSIMLLEDSTPRQVFNELLVIRTEAVQTAFQSDTGQSSIKVQIADTIQVIISTVRQVYAVFSPHIEPGSDDQTLLNPCDLMQNLADVTCAGSAGSILERDVVSISRKFLPKSVIEFRPCLHQHAKPVSKGILQQNCQQWIQMCCVSVTAGLEKLLCFVSSVRGLAAIRDHVHNMLSQDKEMASWDTVCDSVLGRVMSPWQEFFQDIFLSRTKSILTSEFENTFLQVKQNICNVLLDIGSSTERSADMERKPSMYVWCESAGDVPAGCGWGSSRSSIKTEKPPRPLTMKVRAYTPAIQRLCSKLDSKLLSLLQDAECYLKPTSNQEKAQEKQPFDLYTADATLKEFIQNTARELLEHLCDYLSCELSTCQEDMSATTSAAVAQSLLISRVLLLARLGRALTELSPCMKLCIEGQRSDFKSKLSLTVKAGLSLASQMETAWTNACTKLSKYTIDAYHVWTDNLVERHAKSLSKNALDRSPQNILLGTTRWEEVDIQEETEDAQVIKSTIRVPGQASWWLQTLLYQVCEEVEAAGGHALSRSVLLHLASRLTLSIIQTYQCIITPDKLTAMLQQAEALQLLFDVRLLREIMPSQESSPANDIQQKGFQEIIDQLEPSIDPFDLDVFSPYIVINLRSQSARCTVLYGALSTLNRNISGSLAMSGGYTTSSSQEQHNILPLSTTPSRFPTLPLSLPGRPTVTPIIPQPAKTKSVSNPTAAPQPTQQPASFLDTMSTIWFTKGK